MNLFSLEIDTLPKALTTAQHKHALYLKNRGFIALEETIEAWEQVLNHPDLTSMTKELQTAIFNNVAGVYMRRYWLRKNLDDLDQALFCWEQLLTGLIPQDSPLWPIVLNNLGVAWNDHYQQTNDLSEINRAIEYLTQAVQIMAANSSELPNVISSLGMMLQSRYLRLGEPNDLQEAIDYFRQALRLTPADSPLLPNLFQWLGKGLYERYRCDREVADLQEALELSAQAVKRTSTNSSELLTRLNLLQELQRVMDVFVKKGRSAAVVRE